MARVAICFSVLCFAAAACSDPDKMEPADASSTADASVNRDATAHADATTIEADGGDASIAADGGDAAIAADGGDASIAADGGDAAIAADGGDAEINADANEADANEPDANEPDASVAPDATFPDATFPDAEPFGTAANPAPSCKAIITAEPSSLDGLYFIAPRLPTATTATEVFCDMTTDRGGWTKIEVFSESDVDLLRGTSGREMLKCTDSGSEHIYSPAFTDPWSWGGLGFRQLGGTWIVNGAPQACGTDPEYTNVMCPSWWGFGCGNGPFGLNKLFPGVLDSPSAGFCADQTSAHTNGALRICGDNNYRSYSVFIRSEDPAATCVNNVQDGAETDVDCGGAYCAPCAMCKHCIATADCNGGSCNNGRCEYASGLLTIDWVAHCSTNMTVLFTVPNVPAGNYLVTAIDSAATVWPPPYTPPSDGWFYYMPCTGFDAHLYTELSTPPGIYYATPMNAFAAITATTATTAFAGGTLSCPVFDQPCADNHGDVRFTMGSICP